MRHNGTALLVRTASSALSLPVVKTGSTLCLISPVCIKYANPITDRPYKHEIHFPSGIKVMSPFHTNTVTDGSDNTALWGRACVQRCFEDVLKVPSPCFPTICTAVWASGLNPAEPHRWARTSEGHSWNALFGFGWCLLRGKKQVFRGDRMASMFPSLCLLFHLEDQGFPLYPFVLLWCATMIYVFNAQWSNYSAHSVSKFLTCRKGNECKGHSFRSFMTFSVSSVQICQMRLLRLWAGNRKCRAGHVSCLYGW